MEANSLEWVELEQLQRHMRDLHIRFKAVRAMKHFDALKPIEREIAATTSQRNRLVKLLSDRVANQVAAPLATPPEAGI
jgi:hypothetical protein